MNALARTALLALALPLVAGCRHDLTRPSRDGATLDLARSDRAADSVADRKTNPDTICPSPCVRTYAGRCGSTAYEDGSLEEARFAYPAGLRVDEPGPPPTLLVTDTGNQAIRRIAGGQVTTVVVAEELLTPTDVARLGPDDLLVAEAGKGKLFQVTGGKLTALSAGWGYHDGPVGSALFSDVSSLLLVKDLGVLIADLGNHRIRLLAGGEVSTYAGSGVVWRSDGTLLAAGIPRPGGMALSLDGKALWVTDETGLRKLAGGAVTTVVDQGFGTPLGLVVEPVSGDPLVVDTGHHLIWRVHDGTPTLLAGTGESGYRDGPALSAQFRGPHGIALDGAGAIYVADHGNHCVRVIR